MRADQLQKKYVMGLMRIVARAPSVAEGCRRAGIHRSTYYRWKQALTHNGDQALLSRRSRRVSSPQRMRLESLVVARALANPPWGPNMLFFHLRRDGVEVGSASQVWRILKAHGINTAGKRYQLMGMAMGLEHPDNMFTPAQMHRARPGRLEAVRPGELVQFDCFHVGSLKEARLGRDKIPGVVWQYTAIDVASSFLWAQLFVTPRNPSPVHTSALAHTVARDLAGWGWEWEAATTDNGNEFRSEEFTTTLEKLDVGHRRIRSGRPQTNGKVEQVQNTILREFWQPIFTTYREPSITGLRADLAEWVDYYNQERPHGGRWNNGQPPAVIMIPNTGNQP